MEISNFDQIELPISDSELNTLIDNAISSGRGVRSKYNIDERQAFNRKMWGGDQVDTTKLPSGSIPHAINKLFGNTENRIVLATSRLPKITVIPEDDKPGSSDKAKKVEKKLRYAIDNSTIKRLLKDGLRHHELYFIGCIKVLWDPNKGKHGDVKFELIDPKNLLFSDQSQIVHDGFTADGIDIIIQYVTEPTNLLISKFPQKEELINRLAQGRGKTVPMRITYEEVHFSWYDTKGKLYEGIAWRFKRQILGVKKTVYYDYTGVPKLEESGITVEQHNYFDQPRKPFIFFSYTNTGESVYDSTVPIEQAAKTQQVLNRRTRQITEISDKTSPKYIFADGALTDSQAGRVNQALTDPTESIKLTVPDGGNINDVITTIVGQPPSMALYNDTQNLKNDMDSMFNTHGTTRGERAGNESGIARQITREGDLAISDDIVEYTLERVVTEMAAWTMQMISVFYLQNRKIKSQDPNNKVAVDEISYHDISESMELMVKANANDPTERRSNALQNIGSAVTDPYTFYEDMGYDSPKERVARFISFKRGETDGFKQYMEMIDVEDTQFNQAARARYDLTKIAQGEIMPVDEMPKPDYLEELIKFTSSDDYDEWDEEAKTNLVDYIEKIKAKVAEVEQQDQQQSEPVPEAPQPSPQILN